MVNTEKLNLEIVKSGLRKDGIAASLGISRQSLSNKINNRTAFKACEIMYFRKILGLSPENCMEIFFVNPVASQAPKEA